MRLFGLCFAILTLSAGPIVLAADADDGKRLAEMKCRSCHAVVPDQRREVSDAPPFDVIASEIRSKLRTSWLSSCFTRIPG